MSAPRPGMADRINDHTLFGNGRQNRSLQMDLKERRGNEVTRVVFPKEHQMLKCLADSSLRESYNKQVKKIIAVLEQDSGDYHVTSQDRPLEVLRSLNGNLGINKIFRSSKNSGGHRDQTNPEVWDQVDNETVAACSKETPSSKSEKVAKEIEVKLEAEQAPMVKKDQTNPEVQDAVDNETVDDYACSERAPASKSVKADNFNEVLLVPEQMLMVEKDQTIPEVPDKVDKETVDDEACSKETLASKSEKADDIREVWLGLLEQLKPMAKKVQSCLIALFLPLEKMTQGFRAEEAQTGEVEKEAEEEKRRQRIKEVQSCLIALLLPLEKMTQGFRAEEAQTGEVEKEAEEEKRRQRIKEALGFVKNNADLLRQYSRTVDTNENHDRIMALQRCLGLLQRAYRIVSKEQKLNYYCAVDELVDCMKLHTVIHECYQLLKSVIDRKTEGLEVGRFEEAYARVKQSFADIRKRVERWRDAVLHSTVALFSKGSFNSTVRQLMNRKVTTFGKGGNGELVEAFQSGQRLIVKKTLLRESEWSIATEMSHPNVLPWLARGRVDRAKVSLMTLAHYRMVNIPAAEAQEKVDRTTGIYHIRQGFTGEKWLDMVNFTARPLQVDRSKRPSAEVLLKDPYLEQACPLQNSLTDQTNPEVQDEVDNKTVDDEGCSEEMPARKSEKAAKEKEEQLEAEQTPMVKKDQTVDDEPCSDVTPASKSEKAAKEKDVKLEADQTPMVKNEDLSASIRKMGGSIHHYILQLQESEEPNAVLSARADLVRLRGAEILRRILLGLDYMHQQNVVHRDIKASNILLKKPVDCPHEAVHTCTCPGGWEVKVADFDSVIHLGVARDRARRRKQLKVGNTGTSGYRAPEVFYESSTSDIEDPDYYSPASDIWSFGGVCLHLAMGFCCPKMQYQVDQSKRPSAEVLLKDPYLEQACPLQTSFTDQTNPEVQDDDDNKTVDDEGCSEEMPAGKSEKAAKAKEEQLEAEQTPMVKKDQTVDDEPFSEGTPASKSEKAAKEKDVKLQAEQTPMVKNDQTNLEVQGEVDNETVDDEGCSEEMPAGKSEKAAKEKEEQLEAEQTPMVKKDQPNPEVWDEVDNEIVDDEACSEETPADKSEQAANKKEVLLELGQKLIVKKDCAPKDDSTLHEPQTSIDLDSDKRFSDRSHTAQCPATPQSLQPKPNAKQEAASQTEMLSTRSPTSDETVWGGTACSDISDETKQEGEGQDDRCANGPPVGRGESSESAESSNSGDSKSNESSEVGERSRESLCTTPYAAEDSRYPDSLVGYVSLKDCRMQCCTKSYTGNNRLTSYTSYVSTDSPPVTEDGSDSELEYSHQSCPLQTNPGDVINTMLSDHNECCAEKAAGLEGINPPCQSVQENPCLGGSQSSHEVVCMHLKPIPQELRKAIVTGQYANREWLTLTLRSNTGTVCMSVVCHGEDGDKDSDDEDSKDWKRKAMDRLRRENEEKQKKQNAANLNKGFDIDNHSPRASSAPAHSDLRSNTSDGPTKQQAVRKGQVVLSKVNHVFREGSFVPLPSQEALAKGIGKGGNGVVGFIYHGRREFAVKETCLRQEELETWSSVSHPNVIEICAVIEGDWDAVYPGTRICYQMMPRVTAGDIKSMLEEREMPTLCHYFYDFKEDSERAGLVLGNAKYILLSVLNGLKHLHSLGIMHRDIKLQNILADHYCQCRDIFQCPHYGDTGYGVFISDFNSALRVDRGREKLERSKLHSQPIKYSVHGTPGYRPPETSFPVSCNDVLPEWISLKTDIWSFGTMLVKFFVGSRGPHSQREMATLLLADCLQCPTAANRPRGVRMSPLQALAVEPTELKILQKVALLERYFPLATELHRLVQSCLTVNVEERPSAEQVMEKAFFRSISKVPKSQPASSTPAAEKEQAVGAHLPKGQLASSMPSVMEAKSCWTSATVSHNGSQQ